MLIQTLKNGTFVQPRTGERARRQITLRNPANFDGSARRESDEVGTPLRRTHSQYSQAGTFDSAMDNMAAGLRRLWAYLQTPPARDILKCSLAYLLGSMGTFLPLIANFLGHQDGVCPILPSNHPHTAPLHSSNIMFRGILFPETFS